MSAIVAGELVDALKQAGCAGRRWRGILSLARGGWWNE
jgi:hypothetical protein